MRLAVSDDGGGFDTELPREDASLGLASMRERVRVLHGQLDIDSAPGAAPLSSLGCRRECRSMTRPRVPLADDHRMVAEGLKGLLVEEFELAGIVEDGRSLVKAARKSLPDVIVADISMPLLNGIDALRTSRPTTRTCASCS